MKILHISHRHFVAGGSDAVFLNTTELLQQTGHDVVPFCIQDHKNLPSEYSHFFPPAADTTEPGLRDAFSYFWNGQAARNLRLLIANHGPFDIAHLHIYHGKQSPAILHVLRQNSIPIVQTLHEYKLACPVYTMERQGRPCEECLPRPGLRPIAHRCKDNSRLKSAVMLSEFLSSRMLGDTRLPDRLICVSHFQRQIMERAGVPPEKLTVLHNFIRSEQVAPSAKSGDHFLYFGRIERLKGLPRLLEAQRKSGLPLKIAGTGDWQDDLRHAIAGNPKVDYLGFQDGDDLRQTIARARAVIVPSEWYENCPMSVIEAKALGKPVIGTRIGGIPELIRDRIDGLLVPPHNSDALADAMTAMTGDRAREMGTAAQADARRRFCSDRHMVLLHDIYSNLIDRNRAPNTSSRVIRSAALG